MKKFFLTITLLCVSVLLLTACGKKGIVGTWEYNTGGYTYTFNEDGSGNYAYGESKMEFTYTATEDGKLSILYTGNTDAFETTYTIDGNTLNIKDLFGSDTIYKRK